MTVKKPKTHRVRGFLKDAAAQVDGRQHDPRGVDRADRLRQTAHFVVPLPPKNWKQTKTTSQNQTLNPLSISANPLRDDLKKKQNPPGKGLFEGLSRVPRGGGGVGLWGGRLGGGRRAVMGGGGFFLFSCPPRPPRR